MILKNEFHIFNRNKIQSKMIFLSTFPPEIWDEILNFLSPEDLIKIAQISSYLAEIVSLSRNLRMKIFLFQQGMWEKEHFEQLQWACKDGHLETLRWLHSTFNLTGEDARVGNSYALQMACQYGHLEICQWLHSTFNLTGEDARAGNNSALLWACGNGHLETLRWLHSTFNLTRDDARARDNSALRWACNNGHLKICQWLRSTFKITE